VSSDNNKNRRTPEKIIKTIHQKEYLSSEIIKKYPLSSTTKNIQRTFAPSIFLITKRSMIFLLDFF